MPKIATVLHSHAGKIKTLSWVNEHGMALKTTMHLGGFPIEMVKTTSGKAMKDFVSAEFFDKSLIKLEGKIPPDAKSVTYELSQKKEGSLQAVPEDGDFQKAKRQENGAIRVQVERIKLDEVLNGKGNPGQVDPEYRLPNVMIDANDPGIRALARAASRGAKNPVQMASNLRSFVTHYITTKNLDVGFATASEVARTREGDCSEHAVLLAALGRCSGLPSRVAAGLVYLPRYEGRKHIMGFHMWTQFHIRGKWVDFDAAMGESECAPTRIALATSSLKDESLSGIAFSIAEPIGNLKVKILAVKR
ncbi:MAG: transglutaminase domain-containing protein [Verrucomicrobia bacterium]|nr:transglutaminase domain-containing protein [Verrucomicrobiota bacterium]